MADYQFILGHHQDLILRGEENMNLGYNYVHKMPLVPWLYILNTTKENVFREIEFKLDDEYIPDRRVELQTLINDLARAAGYSKKFTIDHDQLNATIHNLGLDFILAGDNKTWRKWTHHSTMDLSLHEERNQRGIYLTNVVEARKFIDDYLTFLMGNPNLERPRNDFAIIANAIKDI